MIANFTTHANQKQRRFGRVSSLQGSPNMLVMPCSGAARAATTQPPQTAPGAPCTGKAVPRSCMTHDELGPHNARTPLRIASRPAQRSAAPCTPSQSELHLTLPRRAVLLALGTGLLCTTASMPAAAADAAKRRNLPVAELQNIIEQDFVEVRSEGKEPGA